MNRFLPALLLALLPLTLPAPAVAQPAGAKKVTLDLNAVAPAAAFKAVADAIGVTATVDDTVTTPVDITVRNVSAKTALTAMCESIGCQWTLDGGNLAIRPAKSAVNILPGKIILDPGGEKGARKASARAKASVLVEAFNKTLPAGMKFENAPLSEVNARLSETLGLSLELTCKDASVQTLTADLGGLTLRSALQKIAGQGTQGKSAWRIMIRSLPGEEQKAALMDVVVNSKTVKKAK